MHHSPASANLHPADRVPKSEPEQVHPLQDMAGGPFFKICKNSAKIPEMAVQLQAPILVSKESGRTLIRHAPSEGPRVQLLPTCCLPPRATSPGARTGPAGGGDEASDEQRRRSPKNARGTAAQSTSVGVAVGQTDDVCRATATDSGSTAPASSPSAARAGRSRPDRWPDKAAAASTCSVTSAPALSTATCVVWYVHAR